jgi:hypothetical protein
MEVKDGRWAAIVVVPEDGPEGNHAPERPKANQPLDIRGVLLEPLREWRWAFVDGIVQIRP